MVPTSIAAAENDSMGYDVVSIKISEVKQVKQELKNERK